MGEEGAMERKRGRSSSREKRDRSRRRKVRDRCKERRDPSRSRDRKDRSRSRERRREEKSRKRSRSRERGGGKDEKARKEEKGKEQEPGEIGGEGSQQVRILVFIILMFVSGAFPVNRRDQQAACKAWFETAECEQGRCGGNSRGEETAGSSYSRRQVCQIYTAWLKITQLENT